MTAKEKDEMKCEWHKDCNKPVMAKIGLPGPGSVWVCREGFDEWQSGSDLRG